MSEKSSSLHIFQNANDVTDGVDNALIIEDMLRSISENEYYDTYGRLANLGVESGTNVPLYEIVWFKFTRVSDAGNDPNFAQLVPLYDDIRSEIKSGSIGVIICHGLDRVYEQLLRDITRDCTVSLNHESTDHGLLTGLEERGRLLFGAVYRTGFVLIDELFGWILTLIFGLPGTTDTIFIPSLQRFQTTEPVLEHMQRSFRIVHLYPILFALFRGHEINEQYQNRTISIHRFSTPSAIVRQLLFVLVALPTEILFKREFETNLVDELESEFGIHMCSTVAYTLMRAILDALPQILTYYLVQEALDELEADNLVVSNDASIAGQSTWAAGEQFGTNNYYLPHSVARGTPRIPNFGAQTFVSGTGAKRHAESFDCKYDSGSYLPLGRPYLAELSRELPKNAGTDPREPITLLVATQPLGCRFEFLNAILSNCERSPIEHEVIVKIHPNESLETYRKVCDENDWECEIVDSNLWDNLSNADLLFTVNSNVGLEAMVAGTPCVAVNFWSHQNKNMPYVINGPVPLLESDAAVAEFFETLSLGHIRKLRYRQEYYLWEFFNLNESVPADVAAAIEGRN